MQLNQLIFTLASLAGWFFLAFVIAAAFYSRLQPGGSVERSAKIWLSPPLLIVQTALFLLIGWLLWRPIPLFLGELHQNIHLVIGSVLYFGGLTIYFWGLFSLGKLFGASSVFGVKLQASHRLVTGGPFHYMRHPMYASLILLSFGGLLLFFTWAMLVAAICSPALVIRARREEQALSRQFGGEWERYAARTPAWLPRLKPPA